MPGISACRAYRDAASKLGFGISYAYDAVGMITQKVSRTASATNLVAYAYDELDRLVREDDGATAREYDYDLAGNRTAMRVIAGGTTNVTAYTLGGGNRLATWTGGGACAYDTAGCVTNLVRSGKPTVALEWDAQYRVTAAYTNGVVAESYSYDALGRRAGVTAGGVTAHYVNEGPHVVAETDASGNLQRRYEYGPGVDDLLAMTVFSGGVTNTYRYIKDLQNTVWAIRDASGAVVESYDYDAWGNVLAIRDGAGNPLTESAIGNRYLFQGREYSWATGLYNFRARWYDPETGRWLCNDPIGISGGLNLYAFCGDNPVIFIDPWGLCEKEVHTTSLTLLGVGACCPVGVFVSIGIAWDTNGNFGFTLNGEVGVGVEAGFKSNVIDLIAGHLPEKSEGKMVDQSGFGETARVHLLLGATLDSPQDPNSNPRFSINPSVGGGAYKTGSLFVPIIGPDAPPRPKNFPMSLGYFNLPKL